MEAGIIRFGKSTIKRLFGINTFGDQVHRIYDEKEYLEAYAEHTDLRVEADPREAIGGMWEEIGRLQFDFLLSRKLKPQHRMLDIGCGTLRGGQHFIRYLKPGGYHGTDISAKAIAFARQFVEENGLADKKPQLLLSTGKDLKFQEFGNQTFDFILAQSVFTHLKPEHIRECFQNIGRLMEPASVFYFTYFPADAFGQTGLKDFCYPFPFFESLAKQNGFGLRDLSWEYNHPRGQAMVEVRKLRQSP
ncbi:class I SAM-dependent DNA methyltransferase [Gilvimarinus sp. F26214L]|uniref:class I SAM-dependent DNA methyltransferase n=1 Tax=Gilvimarinus sp. DZF01 TaxID=3461371 RepID=UPI004045A967